MTRRHMGIRLVFLCVSLISALGFGSVGAADETDPPSRIARLAYIEGEVSFQPGGTDDWVIAPLNRPLTTGDRLWADRYSRVELQLDGSRLRMSSSTSLSFLNLDNKVTQIQLSAGTLILNVRRLDSNETYEVDTPNLAFSVLRPGVYRLTVDESGTVTTVIARSGQGEVTGGGTAYAVYANEADVFSGTDTLIASSQNLAIVGDSFDEWSSHRDGRWESSVSAQYVSSDVVGYEDLDSHGDWSQTPDYGAVWFPRQVESGWAPYHRGQWSYIAPWGYTWVDEEPWGFAPFHYGRWVSYRGAWGWVPAPPRRPGFAYLRPVYAPALVAWAGTGSGVAWFALGPREVYCPSYPVSRHYVYAINASNTTVNNVLVNNIYNTTLINNRTVNVTRVNYANRTVPGAIAATTSRAFMSGQPVSRNRVNVDHRDITNGRVQMLSPEMVPTRQAVLGASRAARARPPVEEQSRPVVTRTPPPPPPAFESRQEVLRTSGGRPAAATATSNIQAAAAGRATRMQVGPAATPIPAAVHGALGDAGASSQSEEWTRVQQPQRRPPVGQPLREQQALAPPGVQDRHAVQQQVRAPQAAPPQQSAQRQPQEALRTHQEDQGQVAAQQEQLRAQQAAQRQQFAQRQQQQPELRAQQEARQQVAVQREQLRAQQDAQRQQSAQRQQQLQMRAQQETQREQIARQQLQQQQLQQIRLQQESQRQAAQPQQSGAHPESQRQQLPQQQPQGQVRPANRPVPQPR